MCLVLGCTGSGKTLLLKRLQTYYHNHHHSHNTGAFSKSSLTSLVGTNVQVGVVVGTSGGAGAVSGGASAVSPSSPTSFASSGAGFSSLPEAPPTLPTVGTNLVSIRLTRKIESTLREVGGCMAPIWKNYLKDAKSLIYVVDLSNRAHVSASCIQMLELLSSPHLAQKPVLILLNKIDAPSRMKRNFFASLVRLDDMMHHAEQPITVLEISAISGHGLGAVHQWLIDNHGH